MPAPATSPTPTALANWLGLPHRPHCRTRSVCPSGILAPDLFAGVDRAAHCLPARRRAPAPGGAAQLTITP
ncbi:hypothetical protein OG923_23790 [Streptomyces halstedii]|uniref:hypothetical protein n=1 Tax=Streptomyces halstedii TaxID=1944 RepID=UPI0032437D47